MYELQLFMYRVSQKVRKYSRALFRGQETTLFHIFSLETVNESSKFYMLKKSQSLSHNFNYYDVIKFGLDFHKMQARCRSDQSLPTCYAQLL